MRSLLLFGLSKGQRDEIDIGSRCDIPAWFCARTKQETFALRRSRNFVAGLKLQADGRRVREDVSIPLALFPLRKLTFALQHRSESPLPAGRRVETRPDRVTCRQREETLHGSLGFPRELTAPMSRSCRMRSRAA